MPEEKNLILTTVQSCYENWKDIQYKYVRPEIIQADILNSHHLSYLDSIKSEQYQIEYLFFEIAPLLGVKAFKELISAISKAHPHVTEKLETSFNENQASQVRQATPCLPSHGIGYEEKNKNPAPPIVTSRPVACSVNENKSVGQNQHGFPEIPTILSKQNIYITGNECQEDLQEYMSSIAAEQTIVKREINYPPFGNRTEHKQKQENRASAQMPYNMDTYPRGVAFIINNVDFQHFKKRVGTNIDKDKLIEMFHNIGWKVTTKTNLTAQEMDECLFKFAHHKCLNSASALAVVILTHGTTDIYFGTNGFINSSAPQNGTFIKRFQLMKHFSSTDCKDMKGKPKWFILQACRGDHEDVLPKMTVSNHHSFESDSPTANRHSVECNDRNVPETGDMCFLFASSLGYRAYRMRNSGSPFVVALVKCVQEYAAKEEFCKIMSKVNNTLYHQELPEGKKTLSEFSTQLIRDWYLNPPTSSSC